MLNRLLHARSPCHALRAVPCVMLVRKMRQRAERLLHLFQLYATALACAVHDGVRGARFLVFGLTVLHSTPPPGTRAAVPCGAPSASMHHRRWCPVVSTGQTGRPPCGKPETPNRCLFRHNRPDTSHASLVLNRSRPPVLSGFGIVQYFVVSPTPAIASRPGGRV